MGGGMAPLILIYKEKKMSGWAAVGQAIGSLASAGASAYASEEAVKRQVEWEEKRAKNAHQWEIEDLKKAGLNPILSAGGSGAITGSVSAPVADTTGIANAVSSGMSAMAEQEKAKTEETTQNLQEAQANTAKQETSLKAAQTAESLENANLISKKQASEIAEQSLKYVQASKTDQEIKQQKERFDKEMKLLEEQIQQAKAEKNYKKAEALMRQYDQNNYAWEYWINRVKDIGGTAREVAQTALLSRGAMNKLPVK